MPHLEGSPQPGHLPRARCAADYENKLRENNKRTTAAATSPRKKDMAGCTGPRRANPRNYHKGALTVRAACRPGACFRHPLLLRADDGYLCEPTAPILHGYQSQEVNAQNHLPCTCDASNPPVTRACGRYANTSNHKRLTARGILYQQQSCLLVIIFNVHVKNDPAKMT